MLRYISLRYIFFHWLTMAYFRRIKPVLLLVERHFPFEVCLVQGNRHFVYNMLKLNAGDK